MPQQLDEYGIPIRGSEQSQQKESFDEYGIPIKKKASTTQSTSLDGTKPSSNGGTQTPQLASQSKSTLGGESKDVDYKPSTSFSDRFPIAKDKLGQNITTNGISKESTVMTTPASEIEKQSKLEEKSLNKQKVTDAFATAQKRVNTFYGVLSGKLPYTDITKTDFISGSKDPSKIHDITDRAYEGNLTLEDLNTMNIANKAMLAEPQKTVDALNSMAKNIRKITQLATTETSMPSLIQLNGIEQNIERLQNERSRLELESQTKQGNYPKMLADIDAQIKPLREKEAFIKHSQQAIYNTKYETEYKPNILKNIGDLDEFAEIYIDPKTNQIDVLGQERLRSITEQTMKKGGSDFTSLVHEMGTGILDSKNNVSQTGDINVQFNETSNKLISDLNTMLPIKMATKKYKSDYSNKYPELSGYLDSYDKTHNAINSKEKDAAKEFAKTSVHADVLALQDKFDNQLHQNPKAKEIYSKWDGQVKSGMVTQEIAQKNIERDLENDKDISVLLKGRKEQVDAINRKYAGAYQDYITSVLKSNNPNINIYPDGTIGIKGKSKEESNKIVGDYYKGLNDISNKTLQDIGKKKGENAEEIANRHGLFYTGLHQSTLNILNGTFQGMFNAVGIGGDYSKSLQSEMSVNDISPSKTIQELSKQKGVTAWLNPDYLSYQAGLNTPLMLGAAATGFATGGLGLIPSTIAGATFMTGVNLANRVSELSNTKDDFGNNIPTGEAVHIANVEAQTQFATNLSMMLLHSKLATGDAIAKQTIGKSLATFGKEQIPNALMMGAQGYLGEKAMAKAKGEDYNKNFAEYMLSDEGLAGLSSMTPFLIMDAAKVMNSHIGGIKTWKEFLKSTDESFLKNQQYNQSLRQLHTGNIESWIDAQQIRLFNGDYSNEAEKNELQNSLNYSKSIYKNLKAANLSNTNVNGLYAAHNLALGDIHTEYAKQKGEENNTTLQKYHEDEAKKYREEAFKTLSGEGNFHYMVDATDNPVFISDKTLKTLTDNGELSDWMKRNVVKDVVKSDDKQFSTKFKEQLAAKEAEQKASQQEKKTTTTEKPTEEQILKDINEGNLVTFTYKSKDEVPDVFKDKISSEGNVNGEQVVRVTVPKSLADYELSKGTKDGTIPTEKKTDKYITKPEDNLEGKKIYSDFDGTIIDNETGKLLPFGEEVKQRIANGEDVTILTHSKDEEGEAKGSNLQRIATALEIPIEKAKEIVKEDVSPTEKIGLAKDGVLIDNSTSVLNQAKEAGIEHHDADKFNGRKKEATEVAQPEGEKVVPSETEVEKTTPIKAKSKLSKFKEKFVDAKVEEPKVEEKVVDERKSKQLELINKTNPAPNDYNTWVRSVDDIKTAKEVWDNVPEGDEMYPDFKKDAMNNALESGEIEVYSSYPIEDGTFITPSKDGAEDYAGGKGKQIYYKKVKLEDVAWLDESQGQFAPIKTETTKTEKVEPTTTKTETTTTALKDVESEITEKEYKKEYQSLIDKKKLLDEKRAELLRRKKNITPSEFKTISDEIAKESESYVNQMKELSSKKIIKSNQPQIEKVEPTVSKEETPKEEPLKETYDTGNKLTDTKDLKVGDYAAIKHPNGVTYEGKVTSVGSKNIKIETESKQYGKQEIQLPKNDVIGFFKPKFQIETPETEPISEMRDIVKDYVDEGITSLEKIKDLVAEELGTDKYADTVEKAFNEYTKKETRKDISEAVIERVGVALNKMFKGGTVETLGTKEIKAKAKELSKGKPIKYQLEDGTKIEGNTMPEIVNGFYSPLEKTISETKFDKLPAKQWIEKFAKGEEAKWTGLTDWLGKQEGSVSKADIQKYLKDNRIEVVEVDNSTKGSNRFVLLDNEGYSVHGESVEVNGSPNNFFADYNDNEINDFVFKDGRYVSESTGFELEPSDDNNDGLKYGEIQLGGKSDNYKEILITLPKTYENYKKLTTEGKQFNSTHFEEPNIIAHLRMNTRTDAEGNKVLFLEELQSDWGQQGKKEGFKEIPNAPFVTDTNNWTKLALKTALKEAIKQGSDKISWTTGEQQNERYDLSKKVDELNYYKTESGNYHITGDKGGVSVSSGIYKENELEGILGKEVAKKIINNEGENKSKYNSVFGYNDYGGNQEYKSLTGSDLQVGGKGMKGFYGSPKEGSLGIVGNVAKSLFKQEPKTIEINKSDVDVSKSKLYDFIDKMNSKYNLPENGRFKVLIEKNGTEQEIETYKNLRKEYQDSSERQVELGKPTIQHSIDITPELKKQVQEQGQPLFMKDAEGKILGFTHDGKIYLNKDEINPNTPIHEAGHIWVEHAKINRPDIYEKGIELVSKEGNPYLKEVKENDFYKKESDKLKTQAERDEYFQHEALAAAIGDKGAQFVTEAKKASFKDWLNNLWESVKKAVGFEGISAKDLQNLSFEDFAKRAAKEILDDTTNFGKETKTKTDEEKSKEADAKTEGKGNVTEKEVTVGGIETPPPPITPILGFENVGGESEKYTQINKATQLQEVADLKARYDAQGVKGWSESLQNGLNRVKSEHPHLDLYEGAKKELYKHLSDIGNGRVRMDDEDLAVMSYLKRETELRMAAVSDLRFNENELVSIAAEKDYNILKDQFENTVLAIKEGGTTLGRSLVFLQSMLGYNSDTGLILKRGELRKAAGRDLTESELEYTAKDWVEERASLIKSQEIELEKTKKEFENKLQKEISELKAEKDKESKKQVVNGGKVSISKPIREKAASALEAIAKTLDEKLSAKFPEDSDIKKSGVSFQKSFSDSIKEIAKDLRNSDLSVADIISKVVRKFGGEEKEKLSSDIKDELKKSGIEPDLVDEKPTIEKAFDAIKDFSTNHGVNDITNDMVGKKLIDNYIKAHIDLFDAKDILPNALNELKSVLPNIDENKLRRAYLKKDEFAIKTESKMKSEKSKKIIELNNITKLENDLNDIKQLKAIKSTQFASDRERSDYEKGLIAEKDALLKEKKDKAAQAKKEYRELETERNRQIRKVEELKEKKYKLEQGLREKKNISPKIDTPEIESLKKQVEKADKDLREQENATKKAIRDVENKAKKIAQYDKDIKDISERGEYLKRNIGKKVQQIDKDIQKKQKEVEDALAAKGLKISRDDKSTKSSYESRASIHNSRVDSVVNDFQNKIDALQNSTDKESLKYKSMLERVKEKLLKSKIDYNTDDKLDQSKKFETAEKAMKSAYDAIDDITKYEDKLAIRKIIDSYSKDKEKDELAIKLEKTKRKYRSDIKELDRKISSKEFDEPKKAEPFTKYDAELIRLDNERRLKQQLFQQAKMKAEYNNKSKLKTAAEVIRGLNVLGLICRFGTLGKVAVSATLKPQLNYLTKYTLGRAFDNLPFETTKAISKRAKLGGESNSIETLKKLQEVVFRQYGESGLADIASKSRDKFDLAESKYLEAKKELDDIINKSSKEYKEKEIQVNELKKKHDKALVEDLGNNVYDFIAGSSIKEFMEVILHRVNKIEREFGQITQDEMGLDENKLSLQSAMYLIGLVGRTHSALKNFSARSEFAAGFIARLEGHIEAGTPIDANKILEIANESYLDWERGKYSEKNKVTEAWNDINKMIAKDYPAVAYALQFDVAITRIPNNMLKEVVVEYTAGAFVSAYKMIKAYKNAKNEAFELGYTDKKSEEFKEVLRERLNEIPTKEAATIARCFRKGGFGLGMFALAAIGGVYFNKAAFGGFPHLGQKEEDKKKERIEKITGDNDVKTGQISIGDLTLPEYASKLIEHTPAFYPALLALDMHEVYRDKIRSGEMKPTAAKDAIVSNVEHLLESSPQIQLGMTILAPLKERYLPANYKIDDTDEHGEPMKRVILEPKDYIKVLSNKKDILSDFWFKKASSIISNSKKEKASIEINKKLSDEQKSEKKKEIDVHADKMIDKIYEMNKKNPSGKMGDN